MVEKVETWTALGGEASRCSQLSEVRGGCCVVGGEVLMKELIGRLGGVAWRGGASTAWTGVGSARYLAPTATPAVL